jgi:hypothetical protein
MCGKMKIQGRPSYPRTWISQGFQGRGVDNRLPADISCVRARAPRVPLMSRLLSLASHTPSVGTRPGGRRAAFTLNGK